MTLEPILIDQLVLIAARAQVTCCVNHVTWSGCNGNSRRGCNPSPHSREPVTTAYLSHLHPCSFAAYLANKLQEQKKEGRMGGKVGKKAECRSFETGTRMLLAILSVSRACVCVCARAGRYCVELIARSRAMLGPADRRRWRIVMANSRSCWPGALAICKQRIKSFITSSSSPSCVPPLPSTPPHPTTLITQRGNNRTALPYQSPVPTID